MQRNADDVDRDMPWLRKRLGVETPHEVARVRAAVMILKEWARFSMSNNLRKRLRMLGKRLVTSVRVIQRAFRSYICRRNALLERTMLKWAQWWRHLLIEDVKREKKETVMLIRASVAKALAECGMPATLPLAAAYDAKVGERLLGNEECLAIASDAGSDNNANANGANNGDDIGENAGGGGGGEQPDRLSGRRGSAANSLDGQQPPRDGSRRGSTIPVTGGDGTGRPAFLLPHPFFASIGAQQRRRSSGHMNLAEDLPSTAAAAAAAASHTSGGGVGTRNGSRRPSGASDAVGGGGGNTRPSISGGATPPVATLSVSRTASSVARPRPSSAGSAAGTGRRPSLAPSANGVGGGGGGGGGGESVSSTRKEKAEGDNNNGKRREFAGLLPSHVTATEVVKLFESTLPTTEITVGVGAASTANSPQSPSSGNGGGGTAANLLDIDFYALFDAIATLFKEYAFNKTMKRREMSVLNEIIQLDGAIRGEDVNEFFGLDYEKIKRNRKAEAERRLKIASEEFITDLRHFEPTREEIRERYLIVSFAHNVRSMGVTLAGSSRPTVAFLLRAALRVKRLHRNRAASQLSLPSAMILTAFPEVATKDPSRYMDEHATPVAPPPTASPQHKGNGNSKKGGRRSSKAAKGEGGDGNDDDNDDAPSPTFVAFADDTFEEASDGQQPQRTTPLHPDDTTFAGAGAGDGQSGGEEESRSVSSACPSRKSHSLRPPSGANNSNALLAPESQWGGGSGRSSPAGGGVSASVSMSTRRRFGSHASAGSASGCATPSPQQQHLQTVGSEAAATSGSSPYWRTRYEAMLSATQQWPPAAALRRPTRLYWSNKLRFYFEMRNAQTAVESANLRISIQNNAAAAAIAVANSSPMAKRASLAATYNTAAIQRRQSLANGAPLTLNPQNLALLGSLTSGAGGSGAASPLFAAMMGGGGSPAALSMPHRRSSLYSPAAAVAAAMSKASKGKGAGVGGGYGNGGGRFFTKKSVFDVDSETDSEDSDYAEKMEKREAEERRRKRRFLKAMRSETNGETIVRRQTITANALVLAAAAAATASATPSPSAQHLASGGASQSSAQSPAPSPSAAPFATGTLNLNASIANSEESGDGDANNHHHVNGDGDGDVSISATNDGDCGDPLVGTARGDGGNAEKAPVRVRASASSQQQANEGSHHQDVVIAGSSISLGAIEIAVTQPLTDSTATAEAAAMAIHQMGGIRIAPIERQSSMLDNENEGVGKSDGEQHATSLLPLPYDSSHQSYSAQPFGTSTTPSAAVGAASSPEMGKYLDRHARIWGKPSRSALKAVAKGHVAVTCKPRAGRGVPQGTPFRPESPWGYNNDYNSPQATPARHVRALSAAGSPAEKQASPAASSASQQTSNANASLSYPNTSHASMPASASLQQHQQQAGNGISSSGSGGDFYRHPQSPSAVALLRENRPRTFGASTSATNSVVSPHSYSPTATNNSSTPPAVAPAGGRLPAGVGSLYASPARQQSAMLSPDPVGRFGHAHQKGGGGGQQRHSFANAATTAEMASALYGPPQHQQQQQHPQRRAASYSTPAGASAAAAHLSPSQLKQKSSAALARERHARLFRQQHMPQTLLDENKRLLIAQIREERRDQMERYNTLVAQQQVAVGNNDAVSQVSGGGGGEVESVVVGQQPTVIQLGSITIGGAGRPPSALSLLHTNGPTTSIAVAAAAAAGVGNNFAPSAVPFGGAGGGGGGSPRLSRSPITGALSAMPSTSPQMTAVLSGGHDASQAPSPNPSRLAPLITDPQSMAALSLPRQPSGRHPINAPPVLSRRAGAGGGGGGAPEGAMGSAVAVSEAGGGPVVVASLPSVPASSLPNPPRDGDNESAVVSTAAAASGGEPSLVPHQHAVKEQRQQPRSLVLQGALSSPSRLKRVAGAGAASASAAASHPPLAESAIEAEAGAGVAAEVGEAAPE